MCLFNSPHVFIFANEYPKLDIYSKDRWKIWVLNDKKITKIEQEL